MYVCEVWKTGYVAEAFNKLKEAQAHVENQNETFNIDISTRRVQTGS